MDLTLQEAAELVGVTPTTVHRWTRLGLSASPASIPDPAGGWLRLRVDREDLRQFVMGRVVTGRWKRYNAPGTTHLPQSFIALRTVTWWIADLNEVTIHYAGIDGVLGDPKAWDAYSDGVIERVKRAFNDNIAEGLRVHWREP